MILESKSLRIEIMNLKKKFNFSSLSGSIPADCVPALPPKDDCAKDGLLPGDSSLLPGLNSVRLVALNFLLGFSYSRYASSLVADLVMLPAAMMYSVKVDADDVACACDACVDNE